MAAPALFGVLQTSVRYSLVPRRPRPPGEGASGALI